MITTIVWMVLTIIVGLIGGAIAAWKNPGVEHERTKVRFVATLLIWVVVFLVLNLAPGKPPDEIGPNTQPVAQETKPSQAPILPTPTLPESSSSEPAIVTPADEPQAIEPSPASDTDQNGSPGATLPAGNVNDSANPAEKTETGFKSCGQFNGPAYEDCMKPYR